MKKLLAYFGYMPIKDHEKIVKKHKDQINDAISTYSARRFELRPFNVLPANERKSRIAQIELISTVITDLKTML